MKEYYPLFRKDSNGVQKLNGREQLPLSLQQRFIFLIALSELSFVSVITASLYLDEDVNPGASEGIEPIYSALYARSNYVTARNRNKCKYTSLLLYFFFQEIKLYFIE